MRSITSKKTFANLEGSQPMVKEQIPTCLLTAQKTSEHRGGPADDIAPSG